MIEIGKKIQLLLWFLKPVTSSLKKYLNVDFNFVIWCFVTFIVQTMSSKFCKQVYSDCYLETNLLNGSTYVRILVESFDGQL